jgi:hypothetical protein
VVIRHGKATDSTWGYNMGKYKKTNKKERNKNIKNEVYLGGSTRLHIYALIRCIYAKIVVVIHIVPPIFDRLLRSCVHKLSAGLLSQVVGDILQ